MSVHIREFKFAVYHANVKPLRHKTSRNPTFHDAFAICRLRFEHVDPCLDVQFLNGKRHTQHETQDHVPIYDVAV